MPEHRREMAEVEELIIRHFDGTLSQQQERELAGHLASSPEAKQLFLTHMRMEGRLRSLGRDGFLREPEAEIDQLSLPQTDRERTARSKPNTTLGSSRLRVTTTSLAVCAVVILMCSIWTLLPTTVNASTVLIKAKQAASELVDRTYHLTLSHTDSNSVRQTRELVMTLRGGGRFVVRPVDDRYVMGSDGSEYWLAWRSGPVWVTKDYRSLAPKLQRKIPDRRLLELAASPEEPLLLEMDSVLSLIDRRYDVLLIDSNAPTQHHVHARLRSGKRGGPRQIDFWSDKESGVVQRVELQWPNDRQATFVLGESAELSEDWYHHSSHAPAREVEFISGNEPSD